MIDPRMSAEEAAIKIAEDLARTTPMDAISAAKLIPSIKTIVLVAITRCISMPGQGMSDR